MPVLATGLPDVLVADRTQRCSAGSAIIRSTSSRLACSSSARRAISARAVGQAIGERVADPLELGDPEILGPPAAATVQSIPRRGKVVAKSSATLAPCARSDGAARSGRIACPRPGRLAVGAERGAPGGSSPAFGSSLEARAPVLLSPSRTSASL